MVKWLVVIVSIIICGLYIANCIRAERKVKRFFVENSVIRLPQLVTFSIYELVTRIKKYPENKGKEFLIEYADNHFLDLDSSDTREKLIEKLESIQDLLIEKRYEKDNEYVVKDSILNIMHDIWLDYAYARNYENVFWRQMYKKLNDGEISDSTFNIIHKKFYSIKREFRQFRL